MFKIRYILAATAIAVPVFFNACSNGSVLTRYWSTAGSGDSTPTPQQQQHAQTVIPHVAMDDMQALPPFASFANAKTTYHAVGDGKTDDTPFLQAALNDLGKTGKASVLYLPAGNYKIASTLNLIGPNADAGGDEVAIVGDSPATTKITWAGPAGNAMLMQNGGTVRYSRITWDGSSSAGYGIAQWWNVTSGTSYGGGGEYKDMIFEDMQIGISAGRDGASYGSGDSEGLVERVTFLRNSFAGFNTGSGNALDWWIWDSQFINCARGVSDLYTVTDTGTSTNGGSGGFYIYRSVFQNSTVADVAIQNTFWFSMHQNTSINSNRFFLAKDPGDNGSETIIEGNNIYNTTQPDAISNGNLGPLILIDNQIISAAGNTGPAVVMNGGVSGRDVFSSGNKYTVSKPIQLVDSTDRVISVDDQMVSASSIPIKIPAIPATPNIISNAQIFEVALGSTTAQIQAAINQAAQAAASGNVTPIVHFPTGTLNIDSTLIVPAQARMQIVGDTFTTHLSWTGPTNGTMIELQGPSYATIRNFRFYSPLMTGAAIKITQADQAGGRILFEGNPGSGIAASNLSNTQLLLIGNQGVSNLSLNGVANFLSVGGGIGPAALTGNSSAVIEDNYYEGPASQLFSLESGSNISYLGGQMAPATHTPVVQPITPPIDLNGYSGNATFIGFLMNLTQMPNGLGMQIGTETAATNVLLLAGQPGQLTPVSSFMRQSSGGNVGLLLPKAYILGAGCTSQPSQGDADPQFIRKMLVQLRSLVWDSTPYQATAGATDVRLYRLSTVNSPGFTVGN